MRFPLVIRLSGLVILGIFLAVTHAHAQTPVRSQKPAKTMKRDEILQLLIQEVDLHFLTKNNAPIRLGLLLEVLRPHIRRLNKGDLPIIIDNEAFKIEDPDSPAVGDTEVEIPLHPRRMTVAEILRTALDKAPTGNATFIVRRGVVEITTMHSAAPISLLRRNVFAMFRDEPFHKAVEELSEQTGANIVIDPRLGKKRDIRVRAAFVNNVTLGGALVILSNLVGAEPVLVGEVIMLTTPENARRLHPWKKEVDKVRRPGPLEEPWPLGLGI